MTSKTTHVLWGEVLRELEEIARKLYDCCALEEPIDRRHWVAERIRQLARDLEPPVGPVMKDEEIIE